MLDNRRTQIFMDKRNSLLASPAHQNQDHTQHNLSANAERRQHHSVQEAPIVGVQTSLDRLNGITRLRSISQQHDAASLSSQKKPGIFDGRLNGNVGSNCNSGNKIQNRELPPSKIQHTHRQESTLARQPSFSTKTPDKRIPHLPSDHQNMNPISNSIKPIQQPVSASCFNRQSQIKNQNKYNEMKKERNLQIDFRSAIQQLIAHFSRAGLRSQRYKELVVHFVQYQIKQITGTRCSTIYQPDQIELLNPQHIQPLMNAKMNEIKIFNQIIQQYQTYLSFLSSSRQLNQDLKLITHQIWLYLMEMQYQRNQELLVFSQIYFNYGGYNRNRYRSREQFDNYVVGKIEKYNREVDGLDQIDINPHYHQEQCFRTDEKQNCRWRDNRQADLNTTIQQTHMMQWTNQLKDTKSYQRKQRQQTVILRITSKIKNPQAEASSSVFNPSQIRSYRLNSFNIDKKSQDYKDWQVNFSVCVNWFKTKHEKTPYMANQLKGLGTTYFSKYTTSEDLAELIKSQISNKLKYLLRTDAKFDYGRLLRTHKVNVFQIDVTISQTILNNNRQNYEIEAVWSDRFNVSKLTIKNQYGTAIWNQEVNLLKVDFARKPFKIRNLTVQCNCEQLNKPCRLVFNDLPSNLKKRDRPQKQMSRTFAKFMEKQRNCKLIDINFQRQMFTVQFLNFDSKQRDVQKVLNGHRFQKVCSLK